MKMNCWEHQNCREEVFKMCPAYPESGSDCYTVAGVKCNRGQIEFSSLDAQIGYCRTCDFYARQLTGIKTALRHMTEIMINENGDQRGSGQ